MKWDEIKEDSEKLLEEVNNSSSQEVAERFNVSRRSVNRWLKKHGYEYDFHNSIWTKPELIEEREGKEEKKPHRENFGDYYVIYSGKRKFPVTKKKYEQIREDYCGTDNLTINQITRKYRIARWQFTLLKNSFTFTHDDVPFPDETLMELGHKKAAEISLQREKDNYYKKLDQDRIDNAFKELKKYRKKEYYLDLAIRRTEDFFANYINEDKDLPVVKRIKVKDTGNLLEVPIFDLHLSRLAWELEAGHNYDKNVAIKHFLTIIYKTLGRVSEYDLEKIILPIGSDFFNFDTLIGETAKGTRQDNDSRWPKMVVTGEELAIKAINILAKVAPVRVLYVPGNHDWTMSYHLIRTLNAYYRFQENVDIDVSPKSRKYEKWGINLIGFTHGDKESKRIYGDMQFEAPKLWGQTLYREWHVGHLHSEHVKEQNGVIVRRLSSPAYNSAWESESGYMSYPGSQCFLWSKEEALIGVYPIHFLESSDEKYETEAEKC